MQDEAGTRTALAPAPGRPVGSDPHDFAGLYVRHRSSFTAHARRYLRDPRDADEVVQEAFLRLFLALPELETELQALAYCRRTITNLCIDRYRSDARRPRLVALEGPTVDELAEDDTGDPVVRAEDAALVREALSRLPALHRAALVKREIEEKPLPVIADELDVAEDSVKHLLFRARRALRKMLSGTSVAPGADAERTRGLKPVGSGGLAGLLVLALLGLGSGPDLRSVPVVGVDLPDVLGVTAVIDAVTGVVQGLVPGERAEASTATQERTGPVTPSQPADTAVAAPPVDAATTSGASAALGVQAPPGQRAGAVGGIPTGPRTVVTVVDGVPVVTVLEPAVVPAGPATGVRPDIIGGRGASPTTRVPTAVSGPATGAAGPVLVGVAPVRPGTPVADRGTRPAVAAAAAGTSKGAEKAADKAADRAERAADKAGKAAEKTAGRTAPVVVPPGQPAGRGADAAADKVERAADKAADKADRAADKAGQAADKAAEKAERAADRAGDTTAAEAQPGPGAAAEAKAADKAAGKAAKAADKADKAADRAAAKVEVASERSAADQTTTQQATTAAAPAVVAPAAAPTAP